MFTFRFRGAARVILAAFALALVAGRATAAALAPDSTLFDDLLAFEISPAHPCPLTFVNANSINLIVETRCRQVFRSWLVPTLTDSAHAVVQLTTEPLGQWKPWACSQGPQLLIGLPKRPVGSYTESIEVQITIPADSLYAGGVITLHRRLDYAVSDTCDLPGSQPTPHVFYSEIGDPACSTCPPTLCPGRAIPVTLIQCRTPCWRYLGLTTEPPVSRGEPPTVIAHFYMPSGVSCVPECKNYTDLIELPGLPPGRHTLNVIEAQQTGPDSTLVRFPVIQHDFVVADACPPPPSATSLIQSVTLDSTRIDVGMPCDSCPPRVCAGTPMHVAVSGVLPNPCWAFDSLELVPLARPFGSQRVIAHFRAPCSDSTRCTATQPTPFSGAIDVPAGLPGLDTLRLAVVVHACSDTAVVLTPGELAFTYLARDTCPAPLTLPVIQQVKLAGIVYPLGAACDSCAPRICPGAPMRVEVSGLLPNACWTVAGLVPASAATPPALVLKFRTPCSDSARCTASAPVPFAAAVDVAPGAGGRRMFWLTWRMALCSDSTNSLNLGGLPFHYVVRDSCPAPPVANVCVWPFLSPVLANRSPGAVGCSLSLLPDGEGLVGFTAQSDSVPLAGLQGGITVGPQLHIVTLRHAAGLNLVMQASGDSAVRYVLYADHGAPIAAGVQAPVLTVTVRADSALHGATQGWVAGSVTAASDSTGRSVPICPIETLPAPPVAVVCFATPTSCDVNGDGHTDVADLVRMARCWFRPETCPDTLAARPDCNGDGAFHVDDILCCARSILGGGSHDSTHAATQLRVTLGNAELAGNLLRVPLVLSGAAEMNGALLHVRYPAERYTAVAAEHVPATRAGRAAAVAGSEPWLPLVELGSTDIVVGVLRLDTSAPGAVTVPLYFALKPGQAPGGDVVVDQGSVLGADGSGLSVDLSATTTPLPAVDPSVPITRVELLCGPNPSAGTTRFVVRLPRDGVVDLSVFDLAGRRVATLVHGSQGAGERTATWDAAGAHSGVYFARLSVDGTVRTTRVTLQLAR